MEERRSEEASNPSKKEIQDEQLGQIEREVRRKQPEALKKGHLHKNSNNSTEVIPFQSSIDPSFQQQQAQSTRLNQHHHHRCSRDHGHNSRSTHQNNGSVSRPSRSQQLQADRQRSSMFQHLP